MKIVVIGGNGTIGKKVCARLAGTHEVVTAGRASGEATVDIADSGSIKTMFEALGKVDAVVCAAGEAKWAALDAMSEDDFYIGLKSKLMGQVNLVRIGLRYLNAGGSITLSTGILADDPVVSTTSPAMVNGGIHSFVKAAALELGPIARVNVVSSGLVEDAVEKYAAYFPGHNPIPMDKVVNAYVKCIEGRINGQIVTVYDNR